MQHLSDDLKQELNLTVVLQVEEHAVGYVNKETKGSTRNSFSTRRI